MTIKLTGKLGPITGELHFGDPNLPYHYHTTFDTSYPTGTGTYSNNDTRVTNIATSGTWASKPTFRTPKPAYENRVKFRVVYSGNYNDCRIVSPTSGGTLIMSVNWHSHELRYADRTNGWTELYLNGVEETAVRELRTNHETGRYEYYVNDSLFWSTDNGVYGNWDCYSIVGEGSATKSITQLYADPT